MEKKRRIQEIIEGCGADSETALEAADEILALFNVVKQSEPCDHDYQDDSTCGVSITACQKCGDVI